MIMCSKKSGFTLVEIMMVIAVIGLLATISVMSYIQYRDDSRKTMCSANLKSIYTAKASWTASQMNNSLVVPGYALSPSDKSGVQQYMEEPDPQCPAFGVYTWGEVSVTPTCSEVGHLIEL